jgi:chromosome segregation ATPase
MSVELEERDVEVNAENIGGIDETNVKFTPGVTVLAGRNATNRTSFLQTLMAALGSDNVSVKGDTDEAFVELSIGDETYTRELMRAGDTITTSGNPYLDDSTLADLFVFLLESNEARQAVARNDDLRQLIMRPVDTDEIRAEIDRLVAEREEIENELDEIDSLKADLPGLEEERTRLADEIEEKKAELERTEAELESKDTDVEESREEKREVEEALSTLQEKRSELEDVRYDLETEKESVAELRSEKRELEGELADLPDSPAGGIEELDDEISRLRSEKQSLESEVNELQSIIQFNEKMLDGVDSELSALQPDDGDGAVTDQLLEDAQEVECWTCGSTVETDQISATVEQLRDLSSDKLADVRDIEERLDELTDRRQERRDQQDRRDTIEGKLRRVEDQLEEGEQTIERLRERREELTDEIAELESEVDESDTSPYSDVLDLHKEANQLEYEIGKLENELDGVEDEIASIEERIAEEDDLEARLAGVRDDLEDARTKIERIEREAVTEFNEHMDTVLQLLDYDNLDRVWIERVEREVREGRRKVQKSAFELHVVRTTASGATYEDTSDHLSESEREVTGLVFALAGYLAHEVYETVPFMLLDSLEAIDADRIAKLVDYLEDYSDYLVVALLPEDAAALDSDYQRVTEI